VLAFEHEGDGGRVELIGDYPFRFRHTREMMMNEMMDGSGSMMWGTGLWGMGWGGLLVVGVVVLGIAVLAKYLVFDNRRKNL
jgi:hypothetical protein